MRCFRASGPPVFGMIARLIERKQISDLMSKNGLELTEGVGELAIDVVVAGGVLLGEQVELGVVHRYRVQLCKAALQLQRIDLAVPLVDGRAALVLLLNVYFHLLSTQEAGIFVLHAVGARLPHLDTLLGPGRTPRPTHAFGLREQGALSHRVHLLRQVEVIYHAPAADLLSAHQVSLCLVLAEAPGAAWQLIGLHSDDVLVEPWSMSGVLAVHSDGRACVFHHQLLLALGLD